MSEGKLKSEVKFEISLDENKVPDNIKWHASDAGVEADCKAVMMSVWDKDSQETLSLNLWTKEMSTEEMKRFFHQSFFNMIESFQKAVPNQEEMVGDLFATCNYFAERMELISKEDLDRMNKESKSDSGDDVDLKSML